MGTEQPGHRTCCPAGPCTERLWVLQNEVGVGSTHNTRISAVGAFAAHVGVLRPRGESSLSQPTGCPDLVFAFTAPFASHHQPWTDDLLPPTASLEVTTSMEETDFSTSKVRARRVVEEENSTQMNSHLAVIANTFITMRKCEQRKGFKWLCSLYICLFHRLQNP